MIGIGIEKEIFSSNYFSYHYGYKNLNNFKFKDKSKLKNSEEKILKYFKEINFNVIFLNPSSKGNYVNFCMNDKSTETYAKIESDLKIKKYQNADSFSFKLDDIGKSDLNHREIYIRPNFYELGIDSKKVMTLIKDFNPSFYAIGFDVKNQIPILNDLHLELYPQRSTNGSRQFINKLIQYGVLNTDKFKTYFLKFKKFSHIKIRIIEEEITNIKYYRSINVNIPEFYYV